MKRPAPPQFIAIDALRIGMVIHLDGGWMSHPFALNTFRIVSADQIETLRRLGMTRVRWWPRSAAVESPGSADSPGSEVAATTQAVAETLRAGATAPDPGGSATMAGERDADRLVWQRCQRRFRAAHRSCKQAMDQVAMKPDLARSQTEALAQGLLETMLGAEEVCVRLMVDPTEDRIANHALNVMVLSMLMGRSFGLSEVELLDLGVGAMLHDVGKSDLPLGLRHRRDDFSAAEHRDYEEHVALGLAHARRMGLSSGATLVMAQHHELADGSGFPLRLTADRMSAAARIVAIVNRYDNVCNPPLQARGLTPHEAVSSLFTHGKDKYETALLNGFIRMIGVYPPGSTVQLTDDRHALVLSAHSGRPLKPQVLVHAPGTPREAAVPLDLAHTDGLGIRRSIRPSQLPPAALEYLAPRERVSYFFEPAPADRAAA